MELYLPPLEQYTHPLFSGDEWTSQVVVISTYSVIASRHGRNAQGN